MASRHYGQLGIKNAIRPIAIGKKHWLFIGAAEAGERSGIIYTVNKICRRRRIDPFVYLRDVLTSLRNQNRQIPQVPPKPGAKPNAPRNERPHYNRQSTDL